MSKTRTKRQTIRCQKQGQKDKQYDVKNKDKKTNIIDIVLSVFQIVASDYSLFLVIQVQVNLKFS
jgi:hypothetical protein